MTWSICILGDAEGDRFAAEPVGELDQHLIFRTARVLATAPKDFSARHKGPVPLAEMRRRTQLVITERSPILRDADLGVVSDSVWRLSDFHAKRQFLLGGFGPGARCRCTW